MKQSSPARPVRALLFSGQPRDAHGRWFVVIANEGAPGTASPPPRSRTSGNGKTMYWMAGPPSPSFMPVIKLMPNSKEASGMDTGAFKTFWQRLAFSGRGQQPKS